MVRARFAPLALSVLLVGCFASGADQDVDVTPVAATGAVVQLAPLPPVRFSGDPTRIGFEPIPLEGGDFPVLTSFAFLPNSGEFLAVNRSGKVGHFRLEANRAVMIDSFQIPAVFTGGDCAASSIVVDPDFVSNRLFYVGYCIDAQYNVVKRYTMSSVDFGETLYTAANVLAVGDPKADVPQHSIGTLAFGPDGAMWANIGDRRRDVNAQDLTNELGKIVRFSPLKKANVSGYGLVEGNAFSNNSQRSGLVYAYGLRNPWRGAFDEKGRYWVADARSTSYEEINVIAKAGQNFGWPMSEGPLCLAGSCATFTAPVRQWDKSPTHEFILADPLAKEGSAFRSAWVGIEYRPGERDRYNGLLTGKMLYGDFYLGFVRGVAISATGAVVSDQHLGHIDLPVAWQQGRDGYLYVGTMYASFDRDRENEGDENLLPQAQQGQLWRVVPLP